MIMIPGGRVGAQWRVVNFHIVIYRKKILKKKHFLRKCATLVKATLDNVDSSSSKSYFSGEGWGHIGGSNLTKENILY